MADDPRYRPQRSDAYGQDRAARSGDPLAELARLIGQDEAFAAAGREGARARQRDAQRVPERDVPTPDWLARAGRAGGERYDTHTDDHDPGYFTDREPQTGWRSRQEPARWDAGSEEDDGRSYGRSEPDAQRDWHEPRYEPPRDEVDPYRIAAQDGRYDHASDEGRYDEEPESRINPFDRGHDRMDIDEGHSRGRRRGGVLTIAAVLGLAAVGTAAAFGYRAWTSGSSSAPPPLIKADTAPSKVVPAPGGDGQPNKLIYDRIGEKIQSSSDKILPREEQPVELRDMARQPGARPALPPPGTPGSVTIGAQPPAYAAPPPSVGTAGPNEPKRVHTITIRPDQTMTLPGPAETEPSPVRPVAPGAGPAAPQAARSPAPAPMKPSPAPKPAGGSAPLALNPSADALPRSAPEAAQPNPYRTAALPSRVDAGNYVVQVSSQRSEADAAASFRALQTKYPGVLGNRQPLIRRADLGSKGVFYRAQVGPFATAEDANQLCSNLKAAGGQCIVQRN
jgi:SPOR domain